MTKIEQIEREIKALSTEEFAELRRWISEYDADLWDREFEEDVAAGRLDALAEEAIREDEAGETHLL